MQINARITKLKFELNQYITISGYAFSKFDESRIGGQKTNRFNLDWYWYSGEVPEPVVLAITEVYDEISSYLTEQGVIPRKWDSMLTGGKVDDGIFRFNITDFVIRNPEWGNRNSTVTVEAYSNTFGDGPLIRTLQVYVEKDNATKLFEVLDEYL